MDTASSGNTDSLQAALELHREGALEEAQQQYTRLLKGRPDDANLLQLSGLAAHQLGDHRQAVRLISAAIRIQPAVAALHNNLGEAHRALGEHRQAIAAYQQALALKPGHAAYHCNLARALDQAGQPEQAWRQYQRSLELDHRSVPALQACADMLLRTGEAVAARPLLERAQALAPEDCDSLCLLARACLALGEKQQADVACRSAAKLARTALQHHRLAWIMVELGREGEAEARFRQAAELDPSWAEPYHGLASLALAQGKRETAAKDACRRALALDPALGRVHLLLAGRRRFCTLDDPDIRAAEAAVAQGVGSDVDITAFHFALGKMYEDCARFDQAFEQFRIGNQRVRKSLPRRWETAEQRHMRIMATFNPAFFKQRQGWGSTSEVPVFIVGMPRSGTTLAEQIIASHPEAEGRGELRLLSGLLVRHASVAESNDAVAIAASLSAEKVRELATAYEHELRGGSEKQLRRICDKMPTNYRHIGLIHLMFPNARIIHCTRDPLDTCVSNFCTWFAEGHRESTDLAELGHHYRQYQRLMDHWCTVLPGRLFPLSYERLVTQPKDTVKALLAHLELPWDERCLAFDKAPRSVHTASVNQVRQQLYATSVGRWRNYQPWIRPLIEALES